MITLFARHTVSDYEKWAEAYRNHDFATLEEAHAFADSPELHTARPGAGVSGTPTLWFTSKL